MVNQTDKQALTLRLKKKARELGFAAVGVTPATVVGNGLLERWLQQDYHGAMNYMARDPGKRTDPSRVLKGVRSIVSLAMSYYHRYPLPYQDRRRAVISRYASGEDYHHVMYPRLRTLLAWIEQQVPGTRGRCYVDTGPVLDKHWASQAGLGWLGKHTNVIAKRKLGSWFFIGELLLDLELEYDSPGSDHCGSCTLCLEVCPTEAIVEPYVVDSRRCISYLTIELRDDIPEELRPDMGNLVFGCDICQDVCPWNRKAEESPHAEFEARPWLRNPELGELSKIRREDFARRFRGSPVKRPKWNGLMRNLAVAMGNSGSPRMIPDLKRLLHEEDAMVRRHAAWALARIGGSTCQEMLRQRLRMESDPRTRRSIGRLLQSTSQTGT